jgi:hypothetical protein
MLTGWRSGLSVGGYAADVTAGVTLRSRNVCSSAIGQRTRSSEWQFSRPIMRPIEPGIVPT